MFACRELAGAHFDGIDRAQLRRLPLRSMNGADERHSGMDVDESGQNYDDDLEWQSDASTLEAAVQAELDEKVDWLVVDHYGLDARWERRVRSIAKRVMVIDDLADRSHDADVLLDQNLHPAPGERYGGKLPPGCRTFFGPPYALLRDEFYEVARTRRIRGGALSRVLIAFGGADVANDTLVALSALIDADLPGVSIDVVVGPVNPHRSILEATARLGRDVRVHFSPPQIAQLLDSADLAIGAGGISTWERCVLGVPSITLACADNQREQLESLNSAGCVVNLGSSNRVRADDIAAAVLDFRRSPELLRKMSEAARSIMGRDPEECGRVLVHAFFE